MKSRFSMFLILVLGLSFKTYSAPSPFIGSASENNQKYNNYYFFTDKTISKTQFNNPANFASDALRSVVVPIADRINLLVWQEFKQPLPVAPEPYDRKKHFGTWIVDSRTGSCLNVRGIVLVRDSKAQVGMVPGNNCFVADGKWHDPYSNKVFKSSRDIQIDHMVPLKHAYISGGWKWDEKIKCLYSNYMGYKGHLVSASGYENQSKSDSTPYSYLPPNPAYVCTYLAEWLRIKLIWNLALIPPEVQAIANAYKKYSCNSAQFEVSIQQLKAQRQWIQENRNLCDYNVAPSYSNMPVAAVGQ